MEIIMIVVILSSQISELKELLLTKTDKAACIDWLTNVQGYEGSLLKVTSKNGKTASPVGFVTFSSRASAEAAKQDLQVRCCFVMTSTSPTSPLTHTQREDDLSLDNIRVPRNTYTLHLSRWGLDLNWSHFCSPREDIPLTRHIQGLNRYFFRQNLML